MDRMPDLTARLLGENFEEALEELADIYGHVDGSEMDALNAIRELHTRLATAKAEGAAEELERLAASGDFGSAVNVELRLRADQIIKQVQG